MHSTVYDMTRRCGDSPGRGTPTLEVGMHSQSTLLICPISDCGRPVHAGGLCSAHYQRLKRSGVIRPEDPVGDRGYVRARAQALEDRFWPKVDRNGQIPAYRPDLGPCWQWVAMLDKAGYGRVRSGGGRNGESIYAHRVSYQLLIGQIPDGLVLDHLCRNRGCVNPTHLEPVTQGENTRRAVWPNHCRRGHEYTPENTGVSGGSRYCRICSRLNAKVQKAKRRARNG